MATNFAEAFLSARNNAQDRTRQREADAMQRQQFDLQMQTAQQKQQGSQQQALYGLAKGYKDYLGKNPQGGAAYYENFLRPSLAGLGLGDSGPYNEAEAISLADQVLAAYGGQQTGSSVQSTYVDNEGNRVAVMRDGSRQILGQNAQSNQVIDSGNGYYLVNRRDGNAAPVNIGGGQAPQPQGVYIDPSLPAPVQEQIRQSLSTGAEIPDQMFLGERQPAQQLRSTPKAPSGYTANPDGSLSMIPGGPAQVAADARADAAAARKAAEDVKAAQKAQEASQRQLESAQSAQDLIGAIDQLTASSGFSDLGTTWGDAQIMTPFVRNDAKDAQGQLKNVASQVAMATLARLKSLSATGATGFGALSNQELTLIQNAISNLQSEDISNAELRRSLKTIRDKMEKVATWRPQATPTAPAADDDIDSLLDMYR